MRCSNIENPTNGSTMALLREQLHGLCIADNHAKQHIMETTTRL
jgi:hypothetical protein